MSEHLVLRIVVKILLPFIMMFAFYIQLHGEHSPGGGFQAGVVMASAFIIYALIFGLDKTLKIVSLRLLKSLLSGGLLLYAGTGLAGMFMGDAYLDYKFLHQDPQYAQQLGIIIVEAGVGITVFAAILLIFIGFARCSKV
jgi:multicomponent Na+:H+ antiporter subunit B